MKNLLSLIVAVAFSTISLFGNTYSVAMPEPIKPLSKVAYPATYYAEQAQLWQQETGKNSMNPTAWFNYYRAARYANMLDRSEAQGFDLTAIMEKIPQALHESFEYQYIRFLHADWNEDRYQFLLKAHEIGPQRLEAYHDLVAYYQMQGDQVQALTYLEKLFEAGEFPAELLSWNYNLLASVENGAILLTYGDNDTYPLWVLQSARGIRKDVKVLNVNLLLMDGYREREFSSMGLPSLDLRSCKSQAEMYGKVMHQLMQYGKSPIYLANSMPEEVRLTFGDSLYLTGLALRYASDKFDNLAVLKNNFENRFLLDYLKVDFSPDSITSVMSGMNLQYLPAFVLLHQHYVNSGDYVKASNLEILMERVAKEGGRMDALQGYLDGKNAKTPPIESSISIRTFDKGMKKISGNNHLFAFETEVTNAQYEAFLMDLVKNKEFDLLEKCKAPRTDWRSLLPDQYKNLPDSEVFKNGHPDGPTMPVVNISYEAAKAYCDWITKVYNTSADKKKAYKKVTFRLPTEAEWELAATAGRKAVPYPWGGYFIRNNKGCFLANYNVSKEDFCKDCPNASHDRPDDGGFFPVAADAYFPNDFGLYNISGNVAEMIDQPGVTKGGSWNEIPFYGQITSKNTYEKPQPFIGFRVFMEVIE